jgi:signal transduction histidine kinase
MEHYSVLLVSGDDRTRDALADALSENSAITVRSLAELGDLYDVLTNETIHCLVLPPTVEDTSAVRIAHGVRGLFPDLPVIVAGEPDRAVPEDLGITVVEATSVGADAVGRAIEAAVAGGVTSDAARPPSRMETLLLSMLHEFPVHLYAKDDEARHLITSSTNQPATNLIGLTDLEYTELPEDHRRAAYRDDVSVLEGDGKRVEVEEHTGYIDAYTLTSKAPWRDENDEVVGLVGLTRDITERKRREHAARRQHELLVKVALVAAHELRNELQVAAGHLELLDAEDAEVASIAESHERLSNIVDKVVGLASEEQPQRTRAGLWLSTLSREVWDTLPTEAATMDVVDDAHFLTDREAMSLLLQILFKNAVQHGGNEVSVTVGANDDGLYVADDGTGIDVEPIDRVFDAGYTTASDSSGFGLYVARSIADEEGWVVEVGESADGGARFDVIGPTIDDEIPGRTVDSREVSE